MIVVAVEAVVAAAAASLDVAVVVVVVVVVAVVAAAAAVPSTAAIVVVIATGFAAAIAAAAVVVAAAAADVAAVSVAACVAVVVVAVPVVQAVPGVGALLPPHVATTAHFPTPSPRVTRCPAPSSPRLPPGVTGCPQTAGLSKRLWSAERPAVLSLASRWCLQRVGTTRSTSAAPLRCGTCRPVGWTSALGTASGRPAPVAGTVH